MGFIGVQPATVPLTANDITDGIISTAKISDDAVDNTKLDLTDNYAFTGTISGAGALELVSSSTATQTGLSNLQITLPTTDDFIALKLILRGLKCTVVQNAYWSFRFRNSGGSIITSTSYNYLWNNLHTNDTSAGEGISSDLNANDIIFQGYVGDGTDDSEMTSIEIDIHNSATSGRYTRGFAHKSIEKRHTDSYHYDMNGSWSLAYIFSYYLS